MSERVHVHYYLRVQPFHYVFSVKLICWYLEYVQVKKKKAHVCMHIMSFSIKYVYWPLRAAFFFSQFLMRVRMWAFKPFFSLCLSHYVFCVWETGDPSLRALDHCLLCPFISDLIVLHDLIWVNQCSFIFLRFIFSSNGSSFVLPTLVFVHINLHSMFNIFYTSFLYISPTIRYSSFLFFSITDIAILDSFFSSSIYLYWTTLGPCFMRFFVHIVFYT